MIPQFPFKFPQNSQTLNLEAVPKITSGSTSAVRTFVGGWARGQALSGPLLGKFLHDLTLTGNDGLFQGNHALL